MWTFSIDRFVLQQGHFDEFFEQLDGQEVEKRSENGFAKFKIGVINGVDVSEFDIYPGWCKFTPDRKEATD